MVLTALNVSAAKKKGGMQKVYVFGFVSSFTDSLAYMTDVQTLDASYVTSSGLLTERALYSLQLYGFVSERKGLQNATSAVFYALKAPQIAKKHQKVKKLYMQDPNVRLVMLTDDEFIFMPEEHEEEVIMTEVTGEEAGKKADKKAKKSKRGGKK